MVHNDQMFSIVLFKVFTLTSKIEQGSILLWFYGSASSAIGQCKNW